MVIKPIKTKRDYERALAEIDKLMEARPGSPAGDRLDVLATLVAAYEEKRFPIEAHDAIAAIKFAMEQRGLTRRDLEPYIGSRAREARFLAIPSPKSSIAAAP